MIKQNTDGTFERTGLPAEFWQLLKQQKATPTTEGKVEHIPFTKFYDPKQ